jgi:hypothetical protein
MNLGKEGVHSRHVLLNLFSIYIIGYPPKAGGVFEYDVIIAGAENGCDCHAVDPIASGDFGQILLHWADFIRWHKE